MTGEGDKMQIVIIEIVRGKCLYYFSFAIAMQGLPSHHQITLAQKQR